MVSHLLVGSLYAMVAGVSTFIFTLLSTEGVGPWDFDLSFVVGTGWFGGWDSFGRVGNVRGCGAMVGSLTLILTGFVQNGSKSGR